MMKTQLMVLLILLVVPGVPASADRPESHSGGPSKASTPPTLKVEKLRVPEAARYVAEHYGINLLMDAYSNDVTPVNMTLDGADAEQAVLQFAKNIGRNVYQVDSLGFVAELGVGFEGQLWTR